MPETHLSASICTLVTEIGYFKGIVYYFENKNLCVKTVIFHSYVSSSVERHTYVYLQNKN